MPRPDFPTPYTPLTPGMISRIVEDQHEYDKDPERWERRERIREEERQQERERDEEECRRQESLSQQSQEQEQINDSNELPF